MGRKPTAAPNHPASSSRDVAPAMMSWMPPRIALLALVGALALTACAGTPSAAPSTAAPLTAGPATAAPSTATTPEPTAEPTVAPTAATAPAPTPEPPATWASLDPAGERPAAREDHTWTVDPDGQVAYLFGGRDGATVFGDLWAFDLGTDAWTRLKPIGSAPKARFGHNAAWVPGAGLVVFAGQAGPTAFFDDLWAYDPTTNRWRPLPGDGDRPVARYGSCAALGPDGRLWISHGFTAEGTRFADTRAYDFAAGRWTDETPSGDVPVVRCLHGCWWTDDGRLALYAGQTTGVEALGDLWAYEVAGNAGEGGATWTRLEETLPTERNLYAAARYGGSVVVFGGRGIGRFLADTWRFDATTLAATPVEVAGDTPPARSGAELVADQAAGRLLLFGGKGDAGALGDTWAVTLP